jgi:type I restriction enzyme R subunit
MTTGNERITVELPFLEQLVALGWKHVTGNVDNPIATGRQSFREVMLRPNLGEFEDG